MLKKMYNLNDEYILTPVEAHEGGRNMVLIENIIDECECCKRAGEELNYEDIKEAAECLINDIAFAGFY